MTSTSDFERQKDAVCNELRRLLREPTPFRDWLAARKPKTSVGLGGSNASCPLARFLDSHVDAFIDVAPTEICGFGDDFYELSYVVAVPTPRWVAKFIRLIDERFATESVSASAALDSLDAVAADGAR